jgi:hypothetical protein
MSDKELVDLVELSAHPRVDVSRSTAASGTAVPPPPPPPAAAALPPPHRPPPPTMLNTPSPQNNP